MHADPTLPRVPSGRASLRMWVTVVAPNLLSGHTLVKHVWRLHKPRVSRGHEGAKYASKLYEPSGFRGRLQAECVYAIRAERISRPYVGRACNQAAQAKRT